jgi:hypothetical protein
MDQGAGLACSRRLWQIPTCWDGFIDAILIQEMCASSPGGTPWNSPRPQAKGFGTCWLERVSRLENTLRWFASPRQDIGNHNRGHRRTIPKRRGAGTPNGFGNAGSKQNNFAEFGATIFHSTR